MISNGIDNGTVTGLTNPSTFVGAATGMLNNEQMISDVNTFIFTVKTNAFTAGLTTVQLPLMTIGTYNFWVDWGDGRKDYVTSYAQIYVRETVARTHTYRTVGTYTIRITGVCRGWTYYNDTTNQADKLLSIERWGCLELINDLANDMQFVNCINLDLSNVKDTLNTKYLTTLTLLFYALSGISSLKKVNLINNWDVSKINNISGVFINNNLFNDFVGNWNTINITNMGSAFSGCSIFNQPLQNWNTSNVTIMSGMFSNAAAFNQPIDSWNTSQVTNMNNMFAGATAFDQDIGNWNIGAVTSITGFMSSKTPATFSAANLDAIYNGWSSRPSNSNLSISFGTAKYTSASSAGRAILVGRGWTIVDGGI